VTIDGDPVKMGGSIHRSFVCAHPWLADFSVTIQRRHHSRLLPRTALRLSQRRCAAPLTIS